MQLSDVLKMLRIAAVNHNDLCSALSCSPEVSCRDCPANGAQPLCESRLLKHMGDTVENRIHPGSNARPIV